jgi:peroxidase
MAMLFVLSLVLAAAPRIAVVEAVVVQGLRVGFYNHSCPEAEQVIRDVVEAEVSMDRAIAPGLIRIFFHDCFITV